jgi:hypothetical protein
MIVQQYDYKDIFQNMSNGSRLALKPLPAAALGCGLDLCQL